MKYLVMIITVWLSMGSTNSFSYPIFGTKRYHRGASPRTGMTQHILRQPVYENGYLTSNGYYYYPHHEYHAYGMPTYRGEYKPKAYYYSSGPSYNYYNDREPVSNPLDDLHEEILQENEQERQTDLLDGDNEYVDEYYLEPSESQRELYTNNFLRNMMDYNRQKEKHLRLQQLQHQQQERLNEDMDVEDETPVDDDYFSEIDVNPDDYKFAPKGEDTFDLQKYWDAEMSSLADDTNSNVDHHQRETSNGNKDEDVEELKSLTRHEPDNDEDDYQKNFYVKEKPAEYHQSNNWRPQHTVDSSSTQQKEFDDDYSSLDYDDGSWINWDRKRSSLPEKTRPLNNEKLISEYLVRKSLGLLTVPKDQQKPSENKPTSQPTVMTTKSPESVLKAFGQKEKYNPEQTLARPVESVNKQNENQLNSVSNHSKSPAGIEQSIYDTIKQMISIEQELKKTGSKKRKRYVSDENSLVSQLDSLRRFKN